MMKRPKVGIWWDDGKRLVALTHAYTKNVAHVGGRIDSNLSHVDEWPMVAREFGLTAEDEYFTVPRGRVVLLAEELVGIILHGNTTKSGRLPTIARRFDLTNWKAEIDTHYLTGADADRLFDD
jgi:hypothetical protein